MDHQLICEGPPKEEKQMQVPQPPAVEHTVPEPMPAPVASPVDSSDDDDSAADYSWAKKPEPAIPAEPEAAHEPAAPVEPPAAKNPQALARLEPLAPCTCYSM